MVYGALLMLMRPQTRPSMSQAGSTPATPAITVSDE